MLFKECFKIHIIEYRANQGNVFPEKSSYCKDHAIQGFVNQGPTVFQPSVLAFLNRHIYLEVNPLQGETEKHSDHGKKGANI